MRYSDRFWILRLGRLFGAQNFLFQFCLGCRRNKNYSSGYGDFVRFVLGHIMLFLKSTTVIDTCIM